MSKPVQIGRDIARRLAQAVDAQDTNLAGDICVSPASMRVDQVDEEKKNPRWSFLVEERAPGLNKAPRKWRISVEEVFE